MAADEFPQIPSAGERPTTRVSQKVLRQALGDETSDANQRFAMDTLTATSLDVVRDYADAMDALAQDPAIHLDMDFQPGDMQFVHNHALLHDRTGQGVRGQEQALAQQLPQHLAAARPK